VWQELAKGLMEKAPEKMFEFLHECGALKVLIPELDQLWGVPQTAVHHPEIDVGVHTMMVLQQAVKQNASLEVRWACLVHDLGKGITPKEILPSHHDHENTGLPLVKAVCDRLKVPASCREMALMVCEHHIRCHRVMEMTAPSIMKLFHRTDAIRRPARFKEFVQACECDAKGRLGLEKRTYNQKEYAQVLLDKVLLVDAGEIAAKCDKTHLISQRIYEARVSAIKKMFFTSELGNIKKAGHEHNTYLAGNLCIVNGSMDFGINPEARKFIDKSCKIVKVCKNGLVQVQLVSDPKRLYSVPKRNITLQENYHG
jgi:tRNA nucleotidyltransferase (CCA-adding enzyme)